jgi:transposase
MLQGLFPGFHVIKHEHQYSEGHISVSLARIGSTAQCPSCGYISSSVHSRYIRQLQDLPCIGESVELMVHVRRFRCHEHTCSQKTFAEPLDYLAKPYAQRTTRLTGALRKLILMASGRVGSAFARHLGIRVSGRTLLRTGQHTTKPVVTTPIVLGVDEFAIRRGQTYATLICDLNTRRPIDVLPGRKSEPLIEWLKQHPGVEVVARDRASAYTEAVKTAAPDTTQVADRFHLVCNVSEALRKLVDSTAWKLPDVELPLAQAHTSEKMQAVSVVEVPAAKPMTAAQERRRARHEEIHKRAASGQSIRSIAKSMGLARPTVTKYLLSQEAPMRAERRRIPQITDAFLPYLKHRWAEGCRNSRKLFEEIAERGYTGSASRIRKLVSPWRTTQSEDSIKSDEIPQSPLWRDVRWSILCPREHLTEDELGYLSRLLEMHPQLTKGYDLVQQFRRILAERRTDELAQWLHEAASSELPSFKRLAASLTADYAAVEAATKYHWSTGPVEGQITRVKLLKRMGYGRAGLDLLRARITAIW